MAVWPQLGEKLLFSNLTILENYLLSSLIL